MAIRHVRKAVGVSCVVARQARLRVAERAMADCATTAIRTIVNGLVADMGRLRDTYSRSLAAT